MLAINKVGVLLFRLLLLLLLSTLTAIAILLYLKSYQDFTYTLFYQYGQLSKLDKFRETLLTEGRFYFLRNSFTAFTFLAIVLFSYGWNKSRIILSQWSKIKFYFVDIFEQLTSFWSRISSGEKIAVGLLLLITVVSRLFFLFRFPFHVDERFTYLYFVSKGLPVSMAYYPGPNNHIFYTIICNFAALFLESPLLIMKVPAFIIGIALSILFWGTTRHFFNTYIAFFTSVLFLFAEPVFYYGMQGRGYSLLMLFVLLMAWSSWRIISRPPLRVSSYFWFWFSSVLGFYTIPVFLYPFTATVIATLFFLKKDYQKLKWFIGSILLVIAGVLLLYLPVFTFNGWLAVSGNAWVMPLPPDEFLQALPGNLAQLAKQPWGILPYGQLVSLGIVLCGIVFLFKRNESPAFQFWSVLLISQILVLIGMMLFQRILLPPRVAVYLNIFLYMLLAFLLQKIYASLVKQFSIRIFLLTMIIVVYISIPVISFAKLTSPANFDRYHSFDKTANLLYNKRADSLFVNEYDYGLCVRFQFETNGKTIHIDTDQINAEAMYNYLVIHKSRPIPKSLDLSNYSITYTDSEVKVYQRNNIK